MLGPLIGRGTGLAILSNVSPGVGPEAYLDVTMSRSIASGRRTGFFAPLAPFSSAFSDVRSNSGREGIVINS